MSLAGEDDFRLDPSGDCQRQVTLKPGDSCELLAVFTPMTTGDHTAKITVKSNLGIDSELSLIGVGIGKAPPTPAPPTPAPPTPAPPTTVPPTTALLQAINDDAAVVRGGSVLIAVLQNDHPADDELTISIVEPAQSGETEIQGNQIIYSHNQELSSDRFVYQIQNTAGETATATVTIRVEDPPQLFPPQASDDTTTVEIFSSPN